MAEKNEVSVRFSEMLSDHLTSVETALPKTFNRDRFVQNALAVLNEKPELARINKNEMVQCLCKGAYLGLDFINKECYLIPYGNTVQFQTSYKGEVKFVKRYSIRKIKDVYAKCVREGDEFEETIIDGRPSINFHSVPFSDREIVGVFAVAIYEDGGIDYEVMSKKEVNDVRSNYSKASQSKAWKNSWDEMAKKTVLRRLCKHIETDFESTEAASTWEEASGMEFTNGNGRPVTEEPVVDAFSNEVEDITITEIKEAADE